MIKHLRARVQEKFVKNFTWTAAPVAGVRHLAAVNPENQPDLPSRRKTKSTQPIYLSLHPGYQHPLASQPTVSPWAIICRADD
jgi:hypothetical protein